MTRKSQQRGGQNDALLTLGVAVQVLKHANETSSIPLVKTAFGSVSALLATTRDTVINEQDYVELGLDCADICRTLDRVTGGKNQDDLSQSMCKEMDQLILTAMEIQSGAIKQSQRNPISRFFRARNDKDVVAAWRLELSRISYVFNSEIAVGARTAAPSVRDDIVSEIYRAVGGPSGIINELLKRVEFNALSVLLLAATASRNAWSHHQLAKEWDIQRAHLSRTDCDETLAATIELSLASPAFRELGPDARDLLEVVAFFPQGVDEKNLDWLFPTISDKKKILDEFFALSLTHRNNGFVTMLAPVRDYLRPRDPKSSPLLCAIKDRYFARLSVDVDPGKPGFEEARWIKSEDRNVEHLLDVFTSIDANSDVVWDVCANFMRHLYWFKQRHTVLGLKVERLPDDHPSRLKCLLELSWLYRSVGNYAEQKRLLTCVLELWRERGDDYQVARLLCDLSGINRQLGLVKEGIQRAEEAMEIYERLGNTAYQASCLNDLARSLYTGNRLNDAEETVSRAFSLPEKGREVADSRSHRTLGALYSSKGEREKAIHHFKTALEIASTLGRRDHQFWNHLSLATLCSDANEFDDAHTHIEQAKSYTVDDIYHMGSAFMLQAEVFYRQRRLEDAKSAASRALGIYEELAAEKRLWECKALIQDIERAISVRDPPSRTSIYSRISRFFKRGK